MLSAIHDRCGRAFVVGSASDLTHLVRGDIVVACRALPEYAAALRDAGGLLAGGGMLSSLVTVARELGIPAVVVAAEAFPTISTGEVLLLDGGRGLVRRLPADGRSA